MPAECFICRKHRGDLAPPGGALYDDDVVFASHVFDLEGQGRSSYLGHLIVEPKRHIAGLADLTSGEARLVGELIAALARALVEVQGAEHVYSAVIGHHVPHLHVHVFPRYPGTPDEYRFTQVDEAPNAPKGGPAEIAAVTERIRASLRF